MNENILNLNPKIVWKNFRELTLIPRPSGNVKQVTDFLLSFGKKHCDEAFIDNAGNVVMRKKAVSGMENRKSIVLQAHCDMVPQKDVDSNHNFLTDPIKTIIDGNFVTADKTTLGADDGMGVAAIMAVMEDKNIKHGALEALITVDEETGMYGAEGLDNKTLNSKILINLDSEEDNIFYIGCAGGTNIDFKINFQTSEIEGDYFKVKVDVSGFLGGHSGGDIHKNRPNAVKILFRFLTFIKNKIDVKVATFNGGNMRNAIPRDAQTEIFVPQKNREIFSEKISEFNKILKQEYGKTDPDGKISFTEIKFDNLQCFDNQSWSKILLFGSALTSGVFAMSAEMPGLVETSNNISIVKCNNDEKIISFSCLMRSSVESQADYFCDIATVLAENIDAEVKFSGRYPGWKPNTDSEILKTMLQIYKSKFGEEPLVTAIHAGLECGLISHKYLEMDMISIGPTMFGVHTPSEKVEINSVEKFYSLLISVLENAPLNN